MGRHDQVHDSHHGQVSLLSGSPDSRPTSSSTTPAVLTASVSPSSPSSPTEALLLDNPQAVPLQLLSSRRQTSIPTAPTSAPSADALRVADHPSGSSFGAERPANEHEQSASEPHEAVTARELRSRLDLVANNNAMDTTSSSRSPFFTPTSRPPHVDSPYGTLSLAASREGSPDRSDSGIEDVHLLKRVPSTLRSNASKRSTRSKASSHMSEDLAGAMSGLEGRFGMAEVPVAGGVVDEDLRSVDADHGVRIGQDEDEEEAEARRQENSPHEAVRASVSPEDDYTLSINTPRMWCLSVLFSVLGSSTNLFFSLRYPSVAISPFIALLMVHPLGRLWDLLLKRSSDPPEHFANGTRSLSSSRKPSLSLRQWLAQGKWNEKEHTCVYVSSNVAFGFAFATDVIVEQTKFYHQDAPILYQILLIISTQILGYGFAGLTRRFLVRPSGMIWPGALAPAAMFGTLHKQKNETANGWTIHRRSFFCIVWVGSALFYFLPGLIAPALSYFNVVTWLAPKSVVLANLFGVSSGLGLFPLTFDWAQVTYIGSPLLVPFGAAVNMIAGVAAVMWIIAPIMYYANVLWTSHMPILSTAVFDNTGHVFNVTKILTDDFVFDHQAYKEYSRVFLPITYMLSYGLQFAGLAALLTHTACWHGSDIYEQSKKAMTEVRHDGKSEYQPLSNPSGGLHDHESDDDSDSDVPRMSRSASNVDGMMAREDIHSRLMRRYEDVPMAWYLLTFASMAAIGMFIVEYYPIHLPWYGLLMALGLGAIFFIPNGIIMAITNQHSSIYLICQLICGAIFPGRPIANMVFVTYGYISSAQGIKFASDLKLGHYMKIPPRIMFTVQVVATLVSSLTQIGVLNWMFANIRGLCTSEAVNGFTCPIARVHFNGSILWGVVGVGEFFGRDAIYRSLVWFFPLGAILPIPLWLYSRHKKHSIIRKVNLPIMLGTMAWIPPATGLNFSVWALVCYVFNYRIKRQASAWWAKYNMTLSAALDSGLAFGIVIVFFCFIYPGFTQGFSWWGTEVYKQGCDWQACPYKPLAEGERFGPDSW